MFKAMTDNQKIRVESIANKAKYEASAIRKNMLFNLLETGKIDMLKKSELVYLCEEYNVKKTGNKKDLIHNLKQYAETGVFKINDTLTGRNNDFSIYPTVFGYVLTDDLLTDIQGKKVIANYIAKNELHVPILIGCVKAIAFKKYSMNGIEACQRVINSGFKEEIFQDMKQQCYERIYNAIEQKACWISHGKMVLSNIGYVFKAIYEVLTMYKNRDSDIRKTGKAIVSTDKEGNETIHDAINDNSKAIVYCAKVADIQELLDKEELKSFLRYAKRHETDSVFKKLFSVLACRLQGMTQEETANYCDISERMVRNYQTRIKILWIEFDNSKPSFTASDKEVGCVSKQSDFTASGSYGFCYGDHLQGYIDMGKQISIKGSYTVSELQEMKPTIRAYEREGVKDISEKYAIINEVPKKHEHEEINVSARYTRNSAEKRNRTLISENPVYFIKHKKELLNPSAYPEKV